MASDAFKQIKEHADTVDAHADRITRGLARVESTLQSLPGKFPSDHEFSKGEWIAFDRHQNKEWRLLYQSWEGPALISRPILEESLEMKMRCGAAVAVLVKKILDEYAHRRRAAEKAVVGVADAWRLLGLEKEGE